MMDSYEPFRCYGIPVKYSHYPHLYSYRTYRDTLSRQGRRPIFAREVSEVAAEAEVARESVQQAREVRECASV